MKRIYIVFFLIIIFVFSGLAQTESIHKGKVETDRHNWQHLPLFSAYKGDKIKFDLKAHHKRRTFKLVVAQHPGNMIVYTNKDISEDSHEFVVPDDAVYCVWYEGPNIEATLNFDRIPGENAKDKPIPWEIVSSPDTTHESEFREVEIGSKVHYKAKKKKVKVNEFETTEIVSNLSFALVASTSDNYLVEVPNETQDEYLTKELTGLKVSLVVGEEAYNALKGAVSDGLTASVGKLASLGKKKAKNKFQKKKDPATNYEFVDDIDNEQDKMENASEILEISSEAASTAGEGTDKEGEADLASEGLDMAGYVLSEGGIKQVLVKEGLKQAGLGDLSVEGVTGYEVPSLGGLADDAAAAITPKIEDKVTVKMEDVTTDRYIINKSSGFFAEEIPLEGDEYKMYHVEIKNNRELTDAKNLLSYMVFGNLIVEANYKMTEYSDMVYFDPVETPVKTEKFFKDYEENKEVRVVLAEDVKPWETILSPDDVELSRPEIGFTSDI